MELHQIRYFLAVAETLNFTRAAERCNVTQPTLTRAVQKLEQDLGGTLFHRERGRTHLTQLGREMRWRLASISEQTQEAEKVAREILNLERASLNLGIMCTIGPAKLMPFLGRFEQDHPGLEIHLHETTPQSMAEDLLKGDLDLAFLGLPTPLPERFDSLPLYRENMVVSFAPGHRFESMKQIPILELEGERYLDRLNCEFRELWFDLLEEKEVTISVPYSSAREDWIQNMVKADMGISILPEHSIETAGIEFRPTSDPYIDRSVEIVTVSGRQHSVALAAFLRACRAEDW